jgi:DNA-binding protein H-NS
VTLDAVKSATAQKLNFMAQVVKMTPNFLVAAIDTHETSGAERAHRAGCFGAAMTPGKNKTWTRRAKIPPHVTHFQHRHITNKQQVNNNF